MFTRVLRDPEMSAFLTALNSLRCHLLFKPCCNDSVFASPSPPPARPPFCTVWAVQPFTRGQMLAQSLVNTCSQSKKALWAISQKETKRSGMSWRHTLFSPHKPWTKPAEDGWREGCLHNTFEGRLLRLGCSDKITGLFVRPYQQAGKMTKGVKDRQPTRWWFSR